MNAATEAGLLSGSTGQVPPLREGRGGLRETPITEDRVTGADNPVQSGAAGGAAGTARRPQQPAVRETVSLPLT